MVYFTSRHHTSIVSTITNHKKEGQPLRSTAGHYNSMSTPPDVSSSCDSPDDTDFIPPKRPSNLRRSSLSACAPSLVDQGYDDTPIKLQQLNMDDAITCEVRWMTLRALLACLLCPIGGTLIVFYTNTENTNQYIWIQQSMQPLLAVLWCLLLVFWYQHSPDRQHALISWIRCLCLITLATLLPLATWTLPEYTYCLMAILSVCQCLFYMAQRLIDANERQRLGHTMDQQALIEQHCLLQTQQQQAFLTIISDEIQDAALMILTTLEQFSPSLLLTNTQELLNACSIAVPITSISAIHTTIKQICHIGSQFNLLSCLVRGNKVDRQSLLCQQDFDIGELCQSVGDALAGMASKLDVNLVLYHSESSLHHTKVTGDESALRHGLLDLLRNVMESSTPGACIELGLNLVAMKNNRVTIQFDITHTCSPAIPDHLTTISMLLPNPCLTTRLINYFGGQFKVHDLSNGRTRFEVKVAMDVKVNGCDSSLFIGNNEIPATGSTASLHKSYHHIKFANEPTMQELGQFMENLKGLKMVLHAKEQSVFAKHLTGCLASWNCDISHVPVSRLDDDYPLATDENTPSLDSNSTTPLFDSFLGYQPELVPSTPPQLSPHVPSPITEEEQLLSIPPAFVLIDDHILTLERKLLEFRTRSPSKTACHGSTTAIIYFSSLANYKSMRDIIQWAATLSTPYAMPRIVVVPKPAGPRRYLTALHTAWHNAIVEPHYIPIATSPSSPVPTVLLSSMLSQVMDSSSSLSPPTSLRRLSNGTHPLTHEGYRSVESVSHRRRSHNDLTSSRKEPMETPAGLETNALMTEPTPETILSPTELTPSAPPRISHLKLCRRKKEKGSPLATTLSPPIHVLIVEDNRINQAILTAWMKKHKITFAVASNGQEAVEKWQGGGFHLVLMDIQLPVMSGIEATKRIRAIEKKNKIGVLPSNGDTPTFPVIIVALTASSLDSDRQAALAAGCNDFLTKPVSLEWLEKKVMEWGCMQALIDFEGWRRWKRTAHESSTKPAPLSTTNKSLPAGKVTMDRFGMLLPGAINKRRFSTMEKQRVDQGGRHKTTTKKAVSVDDYMRAAAFVG